MLKHRIITALVLLAIFLPALFYSAPQPLIVLVGVLVAAGAWEWGRLNGYHQTVSLGCAALMLIFTLPLCWMAPPSWDLNKRHIEDIQPLLAWFWSAIGLAWMLGSALLLRVGAAGWQRIPRLLRLVGGLAALWLTWLAFVAARSAGINFLLSILFLVWAADVFAYIAGRTLGLKFTKNKLAPSISPGKSWEGVWGGMLGVVVLAVLWIWLDAQLPLTTQWPGDSPSFYTYLYQSWGGWAILILILMVVMSVVGDLIESLIKRSAGVKDSSGLLPGHGGVLDRIDALLPTLPMAMMWMSLMANL